MNGSIRKRLSRGRSTICRIAVALVLGSEEEHSASAKVGEQKTRLAAPAATRIGMMDWQFKRHFPDDRAEARLGGLIVRVTLACKQFLVRYTDSISNNIVHDEY